MHLARLTSVAHPMFERAMALYRESFPLHEQRLDDAQRQALACADYHFDLLYHGEDFVGLLLTWQTPAFCYVEHFCIAPSCRNQGLGRAALSALSRIGTPIILEIDPPVDGLSIRRKAFYLRAGYCENGFQHVHPPYRPGYDGHPLVVLSYPEPLSPAAYQACGSYLAHTVMGQ